MDVFSYLLGKKSGGGTEPNLQSKSVLISENGSSTVEPDEGYDGLSSVSITTNVSSGTPQYQELEYISTSKQQYIDTGVKPNANTKIVYKALYNQTGGALFGNQSNDDSVYMYATTQNMCHAFFTNEEQIVSNLYYSVEGIGEITSTEFTLNSNTIGTYTISDYADASLYLFGINKKNSDVFGLSSVRLYSFKIYDGNTLIRDFIPVRVIGFETVCLYDKVEGKYYFNLGTGNFIAGDPVE